MPIGRIKKKEAALGQNATSMMRVARMIGIEGYRRGTRAVLLALFAALPAAAQEAPDSEPGGEQQQQEQEQTAAPQEGPPPAQVIRQLPLSRLGFEEGLVFEGTSAEARVLFPLPRGLSIDQAGLALSFDYDMALAETASLRVDINQIPQAAEELSGAGRLDLPLPIEQRRLQQDHLSLGLSYRASRGGDRCHDERLLPDFTVLRPDSSLHLAVDAHQVDTLRDAWTLLPEQVTVSLGREPLSPENFGALLEISRKLLAAGHNVRYLQLPEIPDDAPVGLLAAGLSGARALLFNGSSEEESFAIGHIVVASDAELFALEEAVEAAQIRFRRFSGAEEGEIPEPQTRLQPSQDQRQPMRLVRFLDYPVIAAGGRDPEATAAVLSSALSAVVDGPQLDVAAAHPQALDAPERDALSFAELGFTGNYQEGAGSARWSLEFGLADLPSGRLPTAVELQLILPEQAGRQGTDPLDIYLNDTLLATIPPGRSGERRMESFSLPAHLLSSRNHLRVELRRTASGDCEMPAPRAPAQLLGSSLIHTRQETPQPRDFLEMISHLGPEPLFLLPEALLQRAEEVMPLLASLANTLLPAAASPELTFYGGRLPPVSRPFLLLGLPEDRLPQAPLTLVEERLEMRNGRGELLLDAAAIDHAAVLQLARLGDRNGLWLLPDGEGGYPAPAATLSLDRSNIAWFDDRSITLALQSNPDAAMRSRFPWAEAWLEQVERHRQALLIGAGALLTLVIILLIARARRKRQRKKARTGLES